MEDPRGQDGVLAVLNELAQVGQARLLGLGVFLDDADQRVHNRTLVVKSSLAWERRDWVRFCLQSVENLTVCYIYGSFFCTTCRYVFCNLFVELFDIFTYKYGRLLCTYILLL